MEEGSSVRLSFEPTSYDAIKRAQLSEEEDIDVIIPQRPRKLTTRFALDEEDALSELTPPPSPPRRGSPGALEFAPINSSVTSFFPLRQSTSPVHSNVGKETEPATTVKPQERRWRKPSKTLGAFADLFTGTSAPIFPGPPSPSSSSGRESPVRSLKGTAASRSPTRPSQSRRSSTLNVAATLLGLAPPKRPAPSRSLNESDEILEFDIERELFPNGFGDPTSPTAYDELLSNAERLFLRMQNAYSIKCQELHEAATAHNVERDELEEARTRASHLKLQLDGMSAQFEQQDQAMKSLSDKLLLERKQRHRERENRSRNAIRIVENGNVEPEPESGSPYQGTLFDSEDDSSHESVFSRPGSAMSSMTASTNPELGQAQHATLVPLNLRDENRYLKARIAELEETVENCLGLMN